MIKQKADEAIPFIIYHEKEGFKISNEAIDFLQNLPTDRKLGIISIVGKYRTGKSFFVNRVLLNQTGNKSGFSVGPTINPCTKGLWLWKKTLKSETEEDMDILLVDTEGFGGMDENVNHDSRIFLFSLLLSSYFIYNSVGSIDENALNSLSLIINLAKDIQIKSQGQQGKEDDETISQYFPQFLWVVRDFALQLKDNLGNPISPKEYLEKSLELQKGVSDSIEAKNRIRRMMKHFFRERDCVTMVRPTESEKDLQKLNEIENSKLRPEFVQNMKNVNNKIFKKVRPKMFGQKSINGQILIEICQAYLQAINTGQLPNIENAWSYVCKAESRKAVDLNIKIMEEKLFAIDQPLDNNSLEQLKQNMRDKAITEFKKNSIAPQEEITEYLQDLDQKLIEQFQQFKKKNKSLWKIKYEEISRNGIAEIENKLNNEEYENFFDFQSDLMKFKEEYDRQTPDGPSKNQFWSDLSGKLFKLAAEKVSKNIERSLSKQNKIYEQKLKYSEQEISTKKEQFEMEKQQLYEKIQKLEKQKSELEINFSVQQERNERLKEEKQKIEQEYTITKNYNKELEQKREQTTSKQIQELSQQLNEQKEKNSKIINDLEKELALSKQEKIFLEKELKSLQSKNQENEFELKQMREEARTHKNEADKLQQKIENIEREKQQEIQKIQEEHAKSLEIQKAQSEDKKEMQKQQQEWLVQKTYLENQVSFLKNQLDENKRLHDALLMALQQGMNHQDQENAGELMETNKNLSAAMEKMELRCSLLEEKNEKLKNFKKMVKNSSALQCIHCSKFISNTIFTQHLKNCIEINGTDSSNQKTQNLPQLSKAQMEFTNNLLNNQQYNNSNQNSTNNNNNYNNGPALFQNLEANGLIISINQTMVRESPDNKPYTEYLIQVQYLNQKWTVARKYKNFCELHSVLQNSFQGLKFPQSSAAIINSQTDVNSVFSNKRPTVIEERRKALQQYIRDLCQIDVVRNSKPYKNFLEIDKHLEKVSSYQNSRQNSAVNKNVPGTSRSEIMSMVNSFFQNKNNSQVMQNNNDQENKIVPQSPQSFLKNLQENQNRENQNSSMTSDIYSTPQQNNQQQYNMKQKQQQQYQKQMQQMGGHTKNQNSFSNNSYNNYNNNNNNNQPLSNSNNFMNSNNIYANHANNNRMNYNQKREQNNQQMQYQNFQYDSENMYQQQNQWNAGNY